METNESAEHFNLLGGASIQTKPLPEWNETHRDFPHKSCLHHLFEAQADLTPDAPAIVFDEQQLTYSQLNHRANLLAHHLQTLGVGPEILVGICIDRCIDMVVGVLAILKSGGAYVPLDPTYPTNRLAFMLDDARMPILLSDRRNIQKLPGFSGHTILVNEDHWAYDLALADNPRSGVLPDNLAYVIYTSGSTGKPKGVMITHRNVVNFITGMDECIDYSVPAVWLAVTSLSFDISVLELFWTLARGFKVVVHSEKDVRSTASDKNQRITKPLDFSLFYFASDEGKSAADKYKLLLEGARFADKNGFLAVWTPERHFHAFGGLYPNPAVTGAAVAVATERVQVRAGSCVLPLHSPIRVAEDWALVDNLSNGRVGISFASGWQPVDFAITPENFADRKQIMFRNIETVRALWRGDAVGFPGPDGDLVEVKTLPRPIQQELPVWVTAAGSPDTFRMAGEIGANLLTHLLGQSVEELEEKLAIYRNAWMEAGHGPGDGLVTLMLHAYVGDDDEAVRETVRQPMKEYLRSSVDLIRRAAWSFPALKDLASVRGRTPVELFDSGELGEAEVDALLDHAFERYFNSSGLFGTPDTCMKMITQLQGIGVDEIACLIDFGVDANLVLEHLADLATLKTINNSLYQSGNGRRSISEQIARHNVTHLQCTPSMLDMLMIDDQSREALGSLHQILIGGEPFTASLASRLRGLVSSDITNMYGPTETTIWSTSYRLNSDMNNVPIGKPIANTQCYILDERCNSVAVGELGELYIGGDGVARGYLNRADLTEERFVPNVFNSPPGSRMYRTGDLARYRLNGDIEFLGRVDHQVKIRGHRIELGEIETALTDHACVREAVVMAREDTPGDKRLVGYVIPCNQSTAEPAELRDHLGKTLPDFMIPAHFVWLESFPLTPNSKIDRNSLPPPHLPIMSESVPYVAARSETESSITTIWQDVLNFSPIGVNDDFFALGGHSLNAMQLIAELRSVFRVDLPLRSFFAAPTVSALASEIDALKANGASAASPGISRVSRQTFGVPVMGEREAAGGVLRG